MSAPSGLNVARIKQNVIEYWLDDPQMNWPVKVVSAQRGQELARKLGKTLEVGRSLPVRGCVVSAKFVFGRPLLDAEKILGLHPGDLRQGAVLLRLNRLPQANEFDLAGYTNVPAYPGYPPGLGSNQWVLTVDIDAKVLKMAVAPGQTL